MIENVEEKVLKIEEEIRNLKLNKETLQKDLNKTEVEKGVIENSIKTLENELSSVFNLDFYDEKIVEDLIKKLEIEIEEKEKSINVE